MKMVTMEKPRWNRHDWAMTGPRKCQHMQLLICIIPIGIHRYLYLIIQGYTVHVFIYNYKYIFMILIDFMCIYICMYVCMYVCIHIYIYIDLICGHIWMNIKYVRCTEI